MQYRDLGPLKAVSRLTLGGGGLGQLWGETDRDEAIATVRAAVDGGIDLIDTAPLYKDCEAVIGAAFEGAPPAGVRFTGKCYLGTPAPDEVAERLERSLDSTLSTMRLERLDVFFLHTNICADDYEYLRYQNRRDRFATTWSLYVDRVVPAFEALVAKGRVGAWGITASGVPTTIIEALRHAPAPHVAQAVSNLLDSAGGMRNFEEPAMPRAIIAEAKAAGAGVMGIRAVQAGALTVAIDRPMKADEAESLDYDRAAPFRALCRELGADPAVVAHRYALAMDGVDTVILGVKNRAELAQCLAAEEAGPLEAEVVARIDALGLRET
jgi:aryl-alcohol dehydrogenase-like predicted oxidoreductase